MKPPVSIAVLMRNSLLAGGIASRLQENKHLFETSILDITDREEMILYLLGLKPVVIIVDALDKHLFEQLPLIDLLEIFPDTRIIQVNCVDEDVRVFTSEEWQANKTDELFSKILSFVS